MTLKYETVKNLYEDSAPLLLFDMVEESLMDFLVPFSDFLRVSGLMGLITLTTDLIACIGEDP